jgi:hypothetical protein
MRFRLTGPGADAWDACQPAVSDAISSHPAPPAVRMSNVTLAVDRPLLHKTRLRARRGRAGVHRAGEQTGYSVDGSIAKGPGPEWRELVWHGGAKRACFYNAQTITKFMGALVRIQPELVNTLDFEQLAG